MALPTLITVSGTLLKVDGTAQKGRVIFTSTVPSLSRDTDTVVIPSYKVAVLDSNGHFSVQLPATNDPAWNPSNWVYQVSVQLKNFREVYETVIPYDAAGGEIDFSHLVPAVVTDAQLYAPYNHTHAGGGSGAVSSVFGRTGVVVAANNDYSVSQINGLTSALAGKEATGVAATLVSAHNSDTTDVHGISDTSTLATNSSVASAIAAIDFPVDSVAGKTGAVTLAKGDVGLGNVDNTSDANKPVSSATQTALNLKAPLASPSFTGTVSGVTKVMVGLGNVDNTADASKAFTRSQISDIGAKIIVLNVGDPIPGGTPSGTVIVRV